MSDFIKEQFSSIITKEYTGIFKYDHIQEFIDYHIEKYVDLMQHIKEAKNMEQVESLCSFSIGKDCVILILDKRREEVSEALEDRINTLTKLRYDFIGQADFLWVDIGCMPEIVDIFA